MQEDRSVLVLGVGPEEGLGVALCKAFAAEGYSVFGSVSYTHLTLPTILRV